MKLREFKTRAEASEEAAGFLENKLKNRLAFADGTALMVSGGSTPQACLASLANKSLDWQKVTVMPTDERCVPEDHEASNVGMIRRQLQQGPAEAVTVVPVTEAPSAARRSRLACCLLGMGEDGHFASIFPDSANLRTLLDVKVDPVVVKVSTAASPYPRETANLALILEIPSLLLLAFGKAKQAILHRPGQTPVAALIAQAREYGREFQVFWAP